MTQNNVLYAFVAAKAQTALQTGALSGLTSGYVGVYNVKTGLLVNATAAGDEYQIVIKKNGVLQFSPIMVYNDILVKNTSTNVADTQYTGYLGYNGTIGDIVAESDTIYTPKIVIKDALTTYGNKQMLKEAVYKTANTTTVYKSDVAIGLVDSFIANMSREPEEYMKFSAICSATVTAANGLDYAATVVNGAKTITVATALTYNGTALAVGDFFRIGSVAGGTALSNNVYKVVSISSLTVTLDRAVAEASGTYAAGTADIEVIPAATAQNSATKWGIKFAGQARTNFSAGLFRHLVYDFSIIRGANFDDVLITETHSAVGQNTYAQVAECEWFASGNRGYGYRVDSIPVATQVTADSTATYTSVYLKGKLQQFVNVVGQSPASLVEIKIFGVSDLTTALATALDIS